VFSYSSDSAGSFAKLICYRPYVVKANGFYRCDENGQWIGSGYCGKFVKVTLL